MSGTLVSGEDFGGGLRRRAEIEPEAFRWLVDGHNLLFAIPDLEQKQQQGRRSEARAELQDRLESFGRAIGRQICVVFDGVEGPSSSSLVRSPHLETIYSNPPAEADDQICSLAAQWIRDGESVAVVTSDQKTLVPRLPKGVRPIPTSQFLALLRRFTRTPEKWIADMTDVERALLERSPFESDRRHAAEFPEGGEERGDDLEDP